MTKPAQSHLTGLKLSFMPRFHQAVLYSTFQNGMQFLLFPLTHWRTLIGLQRIVTYACYKGNDNTKCAIFFKSSSYAIPFLLVTATYREAITKSALCPPLLFTVLPPSSCENDIVRACCWWWKRKTDQSLPSWFVLNCIVPLSRNEA